jgi:hypothetical protein
MLTDTSGPSGTGYNRLPGVIDAAFNVTLYNNPCCLANSRKPAPSLSCIANFYSLLYTGLT